MTNVPCHTTDQSFFPQVHFSSPLVIGIQEYTYELYESDEELDDTLMIDTLENEKIPGKITFPIYLFFKILRNILHENLLESLGFCNREITDDAQKIISRGSCKVHILKILPFNFSKNPNQNIRGGILVLVQSEPICWVFFEISKK